MPVQGFVRLRKHLFGRQSVFGTTVAAQRAYPFKGVPAPNLNWTDPDVDTGAIASTGSTDSPVVGTVPTPGLSPSISDVPVYLKDASLYIASTVAGLGAGQVTDALNNFVLRITGTTDEKRAANGSQTFAPFGYGRTGFTVEYEATFHKTADTVGVGSESDAWMSDTAVNRYVRMTFTSTVDADTATPYSWTFTMPLRYYTRSEGEIGGNSAVILTGHAFYDASDFGGFFSTDIVNTLGDVGAS